MNDTEASQTSFLPAEAEQHAVAPVGQAAPRVGLVKDRRAVTALEYGLIAALIAVFVIGAVSSLGTSISTTFSKVASSITSA